MREVKFRVWDYEERQMKSVDSIHFPLGRCNRKCISVYNKEEDCYEWVYSYELMQYISIKDKNGKEIYEGDIVKYLDENWYEYNTFYNMGKVCYDDEFLSYYVTNRWSVEKEKVWNDIEVVGNIYENPEMLDDI